MALKVPNDGRLRDALEDAAEGVSVAPEKNKELLGGSFFGGGMEKFLEHTDCCMVKWCRVLYISSGFFLILFHQQQVLGSRYFSCSPGNLGR